MIDGSNTHNLTTTIHGQRWRNLRVWIEDAKKGKDRIWCGDDGMRCGAVKAWLGDPGDPKFEPTFRNTLWYDMRGDIDL